jgi:di/tricarboxylate transporter
MSIAWLSLAALVVAMIVSCVTPLNVGVLALAFAGILGVYFAGMPLDEVTRGFPVQLFVTLVGVTLLFTQAQLNGTLDRVTRLAVSLCRGNAGVIPVMFFVLGSVISTIGPGNIATAALLAPMAMAIAVRLGIPLFLMAIMVGHGVQSAALSPFGPTGIIVAGLMERIGLGGNEYYTYLANLLSHATVAFGGFLLFGGWKLFGRKGGAALAEFEAPKEPLSRAQIATLVAIFGVIAIVVTTGANIGIVGAAAAVLLAAFRFADHENAIRKMPWSPIVMVCGVTVLISLLEKTGGLALFTALLANVSTPATLTAVMAFVTGVISIYSSTAGVVLPAFLPTIPGLIDELGGGDPLALATSMNVGAHIVDTSPLSTIGAICIAGIPGTVDPRPTYIRLLIWGVSMAFVGALGAFILL